MLERNTLIITVYRIHKSCMFMFFFLSSLMSLTRNQEVTQLCLSKFGKITLILNDATIEFKKFLYKKLMYVVLLRFDFESKKKKNLEITAKNKLYLVHLVIPVQKNVFPMLQKYWLIRVKFKFERLNFVRQRLSFPG